MKNSSTALEFMLSKTEAHNRTTNSFCWSFVPQAEIPSFRPCRAKSGRDLVKSVVKCGDV